MQSKSNRIMRILPCLIFIVTAFPAVRGVAQENAGPSIARVTILSTNDIHGSIEDTGAEFAGMVEAIRTGSENKFPGKSAVILVDGGDQFQGTLMSNYTEGDLLFRWMNILPYDAAVPGNHDYDFGPKGWLQDKVVPGHPDQNPRGVISTLASRANFPLLAANTYYRDSMVDTSGSLVEVQPAGCTPKQPGVVIDFNAARRLEFVSPYVIKKISGVRIAIIGMDLEGTPTTTTPENVSDLCFRDFVDQYKDTRRELDGKADVFVLVIHNGDSGTQRTFTNRVGGLLTEMARENLKGSVIDTVVSGHTHVVLETNASGVPILQSGSSLRFYGRTDLFVDLTTKQVMKEKTATRAGMPIGLKACPTNTPFDCIATTQGIALEGVEVKKNLQAEALIKKTRSIIDPFAKRVLGKTAQLLKRDRINESPLADFLTDELRKSAANSFCNSKRNCAVDVAFLNTGGLRQTLPAGVIDYETLFEVIPFANHAVAVGPMKADVLIRLLQRSIQTCGAFGALMQSGLKVEYSRNCGGVINGTAVQAKLLKVSTVDGELLYDSAKGGLQISPARVFKAATLDFLAAGGSGYSDFIGVPLMADLGIFRELLVDHFLEDPFEVSGEMDGRWVNVLALPSTSTDLGIAGLTDSF